MASQTNGGRIAVDFLFAAHPFTGLEHHALHILRGLSEVNVSVDVLAPRSVIEDIGEALDGHRVVPFPAVPRPFRLGLEQWAIPWRFGFHPRSFGLLHSVFGVAPMLSGVPIVLTVPDLTYLMSRQDLHPRARMYFGSLVPRSIRRARRVMVSSEAIRKEVIDKFHLPAELVSCVPLCVDPIFKPQERDRVIQVRRQYKLPERYVLYVGTIDPRKDLTRLRAAYDRLPPDLSDSALVLIGRTQHGAERLRQELTRPGRRGHVYPLGYVPREDLPPIYSGASVFVYPSKYEGFGLPVLEAMACGTPVVVSSATALVELVNGAGITVKGDSVEELTRAIERLLRFEEERARFQKLSLARATEFSARRLGEKTAEVYEAALKA